MFYEGWDEWRLRCRDAAGWLYVTEKGEGEPLIVLHGGPGGDHRYLLPAVRNLESHFRVVLYDRRGCLRSPVSLDKVSFDADLQDLRALQEELGDGPVNLIAHSAGGIIAGAYVEAFPNLVRNVVLVGPPPLRSPINSAEDALRQEQFQARIAFERTRPTAVLKELGYEENDASKLGDRERTHFFRIRDAAMFLRYPERWQLSPLYNYSRDVSMRIEKSLPESYDYVTPLQHHSGKVVVLGGEQDLVDFGGRAAKYQFDGSPVKLVILKNAGHNAWIDQPEIFRDVVRDALSG